MSEAWEIAQSMVDGLGVSELNRIRACQGITPKQYVESMMQGQGVQMTDNVLDAFQRLITLP